MSRSVIQAIENGWPTIRIAAIRIVIIGLVAAQIFMCCSSIESLAQVREDVTVDEFGYKRYSAEGTSFAAQLIGTWAPDLYWRGDLGKPDAECPMTLGDRFPYPNPFSVPVLAVTIFESSNLKLDVLGSDGRVLDTFSFEDVEQGAYEFKVEQSIWQDDDASLRLTLSDDCVKVIAVPRTIIVGVK